MTGELQPLAQNFAIVDAQGNPTPYFIRWAQQRQIDIKSGITAAQAQQLIDDWAAARTLIAGAGLSGGGTLAADRTFDVNAGTGITLAGDAVGLANTAVTPGTYGDATHVGRFTVDAQGRITAASSVAITGGGGGGSPTLVQFATLRGNGTIALGATPTVNNRMVFISSGFGQNLTTWAPPGFVQIGNYSNTVNNGVQCWMRVVQTGDTGSYALSQTDNHSAVLYEFSNCQSVAALTGGVLSTSGSTWSATYLPSPYGVGNVLIGAVENDSAAQFAVNSVSGVTADFITTTAVNHTGAFFRVNQSIINGQPIGGTITSGSFSTPVYGIFAVI